MRTILILMLALAPGVIFCQSPSPAVGERMAADVAVLSAMHPRLEGSPGEKSALAFIQGRLLEQGIPFSTFDFATSDFQHSFSSCLRVDVRGSLPDTLILAVPLNHPPEAAPGADGSVGIAAALGILAALKGSPPPVSVIVLFLGAEFGDTRDYPMGSTLFLKDFRPAYRTAVMYLNLGSAPGRVLVRAGGTGVVSPYWLLERTAGALGQARLPTAIRDMESQVFRLGFPGSRTIIEPFLAAGYPAVELDGVEDPQGPQDAGALGATFSAFMGAFLASCAAGFPGQWDRHYLVFPFARAPIIVPETVYVVLLAAAMAAALLYSLLFRRGQKKYLRTLVRNFPSIVPLYAVAFVLLLAGTLVIEVIMSMRRFDSLWSFAPLPFLALKLTVSFLIFAALYPVLRRLPFSRNGSFYSAAALFFLIADIIVVAAFNVSFTPYFLWAFAFVLAATFMPNRWVKLILFLPSAFLGLQGLVQVFLMPALPFCRFILLSRLKGNLLVAGFSLPFILFAIRLGLVFRGTGIFGRKGRTILAVSLLAAAGLGLGAWLARLSPYGPSNPQPLLVTQTISEEGRTNSLTLDSPAPIGEVTVRGEDGERTIRSAGSHAVVPLPPGEIPVQVDVSASRALNKSNLTLTISTAVRPRRLTAVLTSPEDFILLDSSFPAVRESPREYRLLIGAMPPDPLSVQVTLPVGMRFTLSLAMDFDAPLVGVQVTAPGTLSRTRLHLVKSVPLGT
jgi:hypothetical protein